MWAPAESVKVRPRTLPSAAPLFTHFLLLAANKRRQCFLPCFSQITTPFESVFIVEISYRRPCALYQEPECFLQILSSGKSNESFVPFCLPRMMPALVNPAHCCCVAGGQDVRIPIPVDRLAPISLLLLLLGTFSLDAQWGLAAMRPAILGTGKCFASGNKQENEANINISFTFFFFFTC